ncbi:hypothetical protein K1719_008740 [Acacia pycnantha]|nr:hypothetical protein K1719_008740 [Acacia pycnantha]
MTELNPLVALTLAFMCCFGNAMRFELRSGHTKCIAEDIKSNAMTVGKYFVVNPNEGSFLPDSHKITVKLNSPHGNNYHEGSRVDSGNFAFTASEAGDYTACFSTPEHKPPVTVTVEFDWRTGVAAKDWSKVAKKGQIEAMEFELRKLYETVTYIHDEMFYLRERCSSHKLCLVGYVLMGVFGDLLMGKVITSFHSKWIYVEYIVVRLEEK